MPPLKFGRQKREENVGLLGTLLIVTICTSITFLTALSMSSIATDQSRLAWSQGTAEAGGTGSGRG